MKHNALILLISVLNLKAQEYKFRTNIDKDSLFNVSIKMLPEKMREGYIKTYNEGNEKSKEFLLFMITMPKSSKEELIENYENKKAEIQKLKDEYSKLVPKNHIVNIEFEPESKILTLPEQITIKIYKVSEKSTKSADDNAIQKSNNLEVVSQNWNLIPGSKELEKVLSTLGWNNQTLTEIKNLLKDANCISIENENITTIGFARSGMGKYFYKLFDRPLDEKEKQEYNNGCAYIYYKDNVVLEYGGGAIGPQCFAK